LIILDIAFTFNSWWFSSINPKPVLLHCSCNFWPRFWINILHLSIIATPSNVSFAHLPHPAPVLCQHSPPSYPYSIRIYTLYNNLKSHIISYIFCSNLIPHIACSAKTSINCEHLGSFCTMTCLMFPQPYCTLWHIQTSFFFIFPALLKTTITQNFSSYILKAPLLIMWYNLVCPLLLSKNYRFVIGREHHTRNTHLPLVRHMFISLTASTTLALNVFNCKGLRLPLCLTLNFCLTASVTWGDIWNFKPSLNWLN